MMAMCCRSSLPVRVQSSLSSVSQFLCHRTDFGAGNSVRFYAKISPNGKAQTVKYGAPKLSWPRHPHHRMPSSWPFTVAVTTPDEAHNVVALLDDNGRTLLLEQLKKFEEEKAAHAGDVGEVPPTVTEVPPAVTTSQLFDVFIFNGLPFIGFGILDNGIMVVAGEYIDVTIGVALGISTMAAAALGNLISDVAGVGSAGYIETLFSRVGIRTPDITPAQSTLRGVRWTTSLGRALGISLGCLIGMLPLLFFKKKERSESEPKPEPVKPEPVSPTSG